ncbi:MAG: DUF2752 domain-containing protein [Phycisphaerales bacterium]|jgi:hypothetical protein
MTSVTGESLAPATPAAPLAPASTASRRAVAAMTAGGCAAVLGVAKWLDPDPSGVGTHTQLHVQPCGWIASFGIPCPTCGMTTSFAYAADGRLLKAAWTQPAGAVLAVATAMVLLASLWVAVSGASIGPLLRPFARARTGWIFAGLILAGWLWKIGTFKGFI